MPVEVLVCVYRQLHLKKNKILLQVCVSEPRKVFLDSITQIVRVLFAHTDGWTASRWFHGGLLP